MTRRRRRVRVRGQSLAEFVLIVPFMLTFFGASLDFARVFQAWITLQGATRDATEYAASRATDASTAQSEARRVVCTQTQGLGSFVAGPGSPPSSIENCLNPSVAVTAWELSTTAPGGTDSTPVASVTVRATMTFGMLFPYPFLERGAWTLSSDQSYSIIQGR